MRSRPARALVVVALTAMAASCTKTLDTGPLQSSLQQQLQAQLGVTGLTATCPGGIKVQAGGTFRCTVSGPGVTLDIDVTQTDDKGNVTWKIVGAATPTPPVTATPTM